MLHSEVCVALGFALLACVQVQGVPVSPDDVGEANPQAVNVSSENWDDITLSSSTLPALNEPTEAAVVQPQTLSPRSEDKLSRAAFQDHMVGICEKAYPDLRTYSGTFTPFLDTNCSVLCIYGKPEVPIPDGSPCYLKLNYVGTPGSCSGGECVIPGRPFEFQPHHKDFPLLYAMFDAISDP